VGWWVGVVQVNSFLGRVSDLCDGEPTTTGGQQHEKVPIVTGGDLWSTPS